MAAAAELSQGSLVELFGLPEVLDAEAGEFLGCSDGSSPPSYRPNGKRGKIIGLGSDRHTVETFDAVVLSAPAECLKPFAPDAPHEGGFHLAWPAAGEAAEAAFSAGAVERLMSDGYCVVQTSVSEEARRRAVAEAGRMKYKRMKQEFEAAYLGRQHRCKTSWMEQLAETKQQVGLGLDSCDLQLSAFTQCMLPLASCALGFVPYSRTNAMVRMPFQSGAEEAGGQSNELNEDDIDDGLVDSHIQFLKRRRVCLLYVVASGGGGELTLIHRDQEKENVVLQPAAGRLIAFLTGEMTYIYQPFDKDDLVLQSWILREPENLTFVSLVGDQASKDEAWGLTCGPKTPQDRQVNVFGIGMTLPAGAHGSEKGFWCLCASGCDGQAKTPATRFDMDLYCKPGDEWVPGYSYTIHGGFITADIYGLDNELFGIPEGEAFLLSPAHRALLEKGYEALYKSGLRQGQDLCGRKVGVFAGHSGDDWTGLTQYTCGAEDRYKRGHQARIWATIAGRLSYALGLRGPQSLVDTACSSALVAYGVGHAMLRKCEASQQRTGVDTCLSEAVMLGCNMLPGPGQYIGLCGPHMLSGMGRCFTFDHSADGYARGEGAGAFYAKREEVLSPESFATVIGACLNQDGRSASMTAPNGPSQSDCIRGSMKEAGRTANEVTCAECHGTGTALGDPIEVGALRAVMQDRVVPILQVSAKSHIGHLEAGAGSAGLIKCMLMCAACAGSPNCHLGEINPHLDVGGYPAIFADNLTDFGASAGYSGVSSFGFGGANSRADVFASAKLGPHATMKQIDWEKVDYITVKCPIDEGPMHYLDGKCVPRADSKDYVHDVYHADALRDEFDAYDYNSSLYEGDYQLAPRAPAEHSDVPTEPLYVVGSWDRFHESHEMDEVDHGTWKFRLALGDTRHERFQLRVDDDRYRTLYPCTANGSAHTRCLGPDDQGEGHCWVIDGRDARVPAGTVYQITFTWGSPPRMHWEIVDAPAPVWFRRLRHSYAVEGSWTGGLFDGMREVSTAESPDTWEARIRIGMTGMEWFRFARDGDARQLIYPAEERMCSEDLAVCGPDDLCGGRAWRLRGRSGEVAVARVRLVDARVTVTVLSPSMGSVEMHGVEGPRRHSYCISGSFNDWGFEQMTYDEETLSTFRYRGTMGVSCQEFFLITAEKELGQAFVPEAEGACPGESIVAGPRPASEADGFFIYSLKAGAEFEISFDRNALDRRRVVSIKWHDRVDGESMRMAYYRFAAMRGSPALSDPTAAQPALA